MNEMIPHVVPIEGHVTVSSFQESDPSEAFLFTFARHNIFRVIHGNKIKQSDGDVTYEVDDIVVVNPYNEQVYTIVGTTNYGNNIYVIPVSIVVGSISAKEFEIISAARSTKTLKPPSLSNPEVTNWKWGGTLSVVEHSKTVQNRAWITDVAKFMGWIEDKYDRNAPYADKLKQIEPGVVYDITLEKDNVEVPSMKFIHWASPIVYSKTNSAKSATDFSKVYLTFEHPDGQLASWTLPQLRYIVETEVPF
jgi:hypothetical protein